PRRHDDLRSGARGAACPGFGGFDTARGNNRSQDDRLTERQQTMSSGSGCHHPPASAIAKIEWPGALQAASTTAWYAGPRGSYARPISQSNVPVHVQLTVPLDAGAVSSSERTDAGSGVCSTRHGPVVSGAGFVGLAMHSVTP